MKHNSLRLCALILSLLLVFPVVGCNKTNDSKASSRKEISDRVELSDGSTSDNASQNGTSSGISTINGSSKGTATGKISTSKSSSRGSSAGGSSTSGQNISPTAASFAPLGKDTMLIGAWVAPPPENSIVGSSNPNYITDANYRLVKESGLNVIYGLYERMEINATKALLAIDTASNTGIKYLISDSNIMGGSDDKELMDQNLAKYNKKSAYLGNLVTDEPAMKSFDLLGAVHENYRKSMPNSIFYINLLPTYATKNQLFVDKTNEGGGRATLDDYRTYINAYISKVKPKYLSYDFYPVEGSFPNLKDGYFDNMSIIRQAALKQNIPFWVFIQTCSFGGGTRVPNKAEIFWQVNTALAYGAQGIQYFTYWLPLEGTGWGGGMISKTGTKTAIYDYVKEMNSQIAACDAVLMNSKSVGVMVNGASPTAIPSSDIISGYKELTSLSGSLKTLVGCFNHNGKSAYYVVNNSINTSGSITLNFSRNVSASVYQNTGKSAKTGNSLTLSLSAGEGVLVELS